MTRFFAIYDTKLEMIVPTYGSATCPALYVTYGMAAGILKRRREEHRGLRTRWSHCEIREVELTIR